MLGSNVVSKIYLCSDLTDMHKGINCLSLLVGSFVSEQVCSEVMFVFRGKNASKVKVL